MVVENQKETHKFSCAWGFLPRYIKPTQVKKQLQEGLHSYVGHIVGKQ
jgi:hypothetical protein